jgi:signal transduction histidine kinase
MAVRDTGPGIEERHKEILFSAFAGGSSTAKSASGGTGLGLYLSQKLARAMGAKITFESVVGEGSTFTLTIEGS